MDKILNPNRKKQLALLYRMQDNEWHKINMAKKELAKIAMRIQRVESGRSAVQGGVDDSI